MAVSKNGKKISFYSVLGKIGDILFWPVLIISILSSFFMLIQRKQNKITSFMGYSFVNVLSGSMVDEGFNIRDTVIVKRINEREVKLGDIIAFYYSGANIDSSEIKMVIEYGYSGGKEVDYSESNINYGVDITNIKKVEDKSQEYIEKAQKDNAKVYFHRVIGIYVDEKGNLFFKTKGSNNAYSDIPLSRGDLLVGKYVNTPIPIRRVVSFCASSIGMIILVCLPLSVLVLMQCLSLIEQISIISLEKRLIAGKISYNDDLIKSDLPPGEIETYNKVYYYYITPPEQKEEVKNYLWGNLLNKPNLNEKESEQLKVLNNSIAKLETSPILYWDEWIENSKGSTKRKLIKYKTQLLMDNLNENLDISNNTKNNHKHLSKKETK